MYRISDFETPHPPEVDERYHALNIGNIGNVVYWGRAFQLTKNKPGTIVECGVGRGRSLLIISALNALFEKEEGGQRKIWGFDSFEGFDDPMLQDRSRRNPKKGEWSHSPSGKYKYEPDFIIDLLERANIPEIRKMLHLEKGYFKASLKLYNGGPIAILHIDCDLYEPYKDILNILYDQVVPGGLIIFDDFKIEETPDEAFPGARSATYEFFGERIHDFQESIKGNPYYVKP